MNLINSQWYQLYINMYEVNSQSMFMNRVFLWPTYFPDTFVFLFSEKERSKRWSEGFARSKSAQGTWGHGAARAGFWWRRLGVMSWLRHRPARGRQSETPHIHCRSFAQGSWLTVVILMTRYFLVIFTVRSLFII